MKTKLIAIILIAFTVSAFSQQNNDVVTGKKYSKAFGVGAGFTTGVVFRLDIFQKNMAYKLMLHLIITIMEAKCLLVPEPHFYIV